MAILPTLQGPSDLRGMTDDQLAELAAEIREYIISTVAHTGGHLGSSLGVVDLTLALHRVLESPRDKIVFDTGHQAYTHKLLTGRYDRFGTLRQLGGIGGFPRRVESEHDVFDGGHAGTGLSIAQGLADGARHPPLDGADRGRGGRRGSDQRAVARGPQRHRPSPDPAADRPERQRDVDQPHGRRVQPVLLHAQALVGMEAEQDRLRPNRRVAAGRGPAGPLAVASNPPHGRQLRPARPALRGSGDHVPGSHPRTQPARPGAHLPGGTGRSRARCSSTCARARDAATGRPSAIRSVSTARLCRPCRIWATAVRRPNSTPLSAPRP